MRLYTGLRDKIRWNLGTILVASRNNRFDAQISQTDKVLFYLGACHLSAENGEHVSLKSMTKNRHPKILKWKKRSIKKIAMTKDRHPKILNQKKKRSI